MTYIIQHPNGEYISQRQNGYIDTIPAYLMYRAKRYTRQVARQIAASIPGAKAIRYSGELADEAYEAWVESEREWYEAYVMQFGKNDLEDLESEVVE